MRSQEEVRSLLGQIFPDGCKVEFYPTGYSAEIECSSVTLIQMAKIWKILGPHLEVEPDNSGSYPGIRINCRHVEHLVDLTPAAAPPDPRLTLAKMIPGYVEMSPDDRVNAIDQMLDKFIAAGEPAGQTPAPVDMTSTVPEGSHGEDDPFNP